MKIILILFFLLTCICFSQEKRFFMFGQLHNELTILKDAHVINSNTKQATYANNHGDFKIKVAINDTLRITSIGYQTKIILVQSKYFGIHKNKFELLEETYQLDEIQLKRHNLVGSIAFDIKKVPKDKRAETLKKTMDFSKINMKAQVTNDHIDNKVRPPITNTDPTANGGAGGSMPVPFGYSKRLWALRKELAFKKGMPAKLLSELGHKFFFKKLKIPYENYYHFLEYCNPLGIEQLYKEKKLLEVIKILLEEHKSYLKIIKKE